jgi:predicted nucleic acid-binding protein
MDDSPPALSSRQIARLFPSDDLPGLRRLTDYVLPDDGLPETQNEIQPTSETTTALQESLRERFRPFSTRVILDANAVLKDLHYLAKTRNNPDARSSLQETIDAGTVQPIAPEHLKAEINENLPEMARRKGIPKETLEKHWNELRSQIDFVMVSQDAIAAKKIDVRSKEKDGSIPDADDLPYLVLQDRTGAPIHSEDHDIERMGGMSISRCAITQLRDYSRGVSFGLQLLYAEAVALVSLVWVACQLMSAVGKVLGAAKRLPTIVQVVIVCTMGYFLLQPSTWRSLKTRLQQAGETICDGSSMAMDTVLPILLQGHQAYGNAQNELGELDLHATISQ